MSSVPSPDSASKFVIEQIDLSNESECRRVAAKVNTISQKVGFGHYDVLRYKDNKFYVAHTFDYPDDVFGYLAAYQSSYGLCVAFVATVNAYQKEEKSKGAGMALMQHVIQVSENDVILSCRNTGGRVVFYQKVATRAGVELQIQDAGYYKNGDEKKRLRFIKKPE